VVESCAERSVLRERLCVASRTGLPVIGGPFVSVEAQAAVRIIVVPSMSVNAVLLIIASLETSLSLL
jgi:hypothetical protein